MAYPSNTNTSQNSELFAPLVTQAQYAAYENSVARQLVTVFDAPTNTGKVLQVPVWSSISSQNITDEAAATLKNTDTSSATITLSEHVVYHQVTDMVRDSAYNDVFASLGDQSGRAIAEGVDTQVFATFSNFSTDLGTANTAVTAQTIMKAAATLRGRKLTGPFYAVLHPAQAYGIKANLTATTSYASVSNVGNDILSGFYIGTIAGVQIFESALVPASGSANNAVGAVFAPSAIGHAMRGSIDMNTLYLPASRATDVVLKAVAGASVLNSTFGVAITGPSVIS
ncbi:hypothetical protein UFOVP109_14 [uncultured Caudovirales phage]|uniref:Major capsid protein Gp5 n=1 Tax=uncultured Caudovirales phage TaxID=2100421 RepID=A0A6J5L848_9CAUD|nr:hypothetical protein UFOVP109_14 [uncultured Caudovirales phage]CAB5219087.1 hypothetical protein UFOVP224_27 [uncultured Caudovirales phage]